MAAERGREDVMMAYDGLPDYEGDVEYETWRRGGNPDLVDRDRVEDYYRAGLDSDTAAAREIKRQRPRREPDYTEQEEIRCRGRR